MIFVGLTLKKNGKWFKISNNEILSKDTKCPYCHGILKETYDYDVAGFRTEDPKDKLPKSLLCALPDSYSIWKCKNCGKQFAEWEIGDYDAHLFYEMLEITDISKFKARKGEKTAREE